MNPKLYPLVCASFSIFSFSCQGQKGFGDKQLTLKQSIQLSGVSGRIDHMDVNLEQQVIYISALGNNSVEAVDLKNGKTVHSIKGLDEPQGVVYIPQTNEVMVANGGNGRCEFYNASSFEKTASVALGSDADDVRYDSIEKEIYVGYGDGGIAVIDAVNHQKTADIKLSGHPEGFQVDRQLNKMFVNVPDQGQIDVADLANFSIADKWKAKFNANFPIAIDAPHHIIFIGYRRPNKLVAISANTGKTLCEIDMVQDTDDLFFDERTSKVYASGGGGFINIFYYEGEGFKKIANIPVRKGARTSLLIPSFHLFILGKSASAGKVAELDVFGTGN